MQATLAHYTSGHDNNFNLIRVLAALAVLASHSVTVATGNPQAEPLRSSHGLAVGSAAVDVFFVVSGLLVTASLDRRGDVLAFAWARILRIWPGLMVCLGLVAVLGAALTRTPSSYWGGAGDWAWGQAAMFIGGPTALPGVFEGNPAGPAADVSLWTLAVEVRMYSYLAAIWLVSRLGSAQSGRWFSILILGALAYYLSRHAAASSIRGVEQSAYRLPFFFFAGASAHVMRSHLSMRRDLALVAGASLAVGLVLGGMGFQMLYTVTMPFLILWLAYVPAGAVRNFNRLGDYSYGIYIYAWPVQQTLAWTYPGIPVSWHVALSIACTLPLAAASWHLIEHRALGLKSARWVGWARTSRT